MFATEDIIRLLKGVAKDIEIAIALKEEIQGNHQHKNAHEANGIQKSHYEIILEECIDKSDTIEDQEQA